MTTNTLTLSEFLLARIAEDEAVAERANSLGDFERWWVDGPSEKTRKFWVYATGEKFHHLATADHIARHDPARVLAECKAKRAIVKFHESWPVLVEKPSVFEKVDAGDINSYTMRASQEILWATEQEYRERFGSEPPPAPMLRALATVYSDHPDFNPDWA